MSKLRKSIMFVFDDIKDYNAVLKGMKEKKTLDYDNGQRICELKHVSGGVIDVKKSTQRPYERLKL